MKNVLIVDDEKSFLLSLAAGLREYASHFNVLIAGNGERAVKILESITIDLVVTDIRMPEMDGFELLAYISTNFPSIPSIVMTAYGTPQMEDSLQSLGTLKLLNKPLDFSEMAEAIIKGLESDNTAGSLKGISLDSFLQLIEMEQKTCLLEVLCSSKKKGFFYFEKGILYDAFCGNIKGEKAAIEMISWDKVHISFKNLPNEKISRQINTGLMALILEGIRLKDESAGIDMEEVSDLDDLAEISKIDFALDDEVVYEIEALESASKSATESGKTVSAVMMDGTTGMNEGPVVTEEGVKKTHSQEDFERKEADEKAAEMEQRSINTKGTSISNGLKGILKEMSDEMDGILALGVVGMDGITVAFNNRARIDTDAYAAKLAVLIKLAKKSINGLNEIGSFEENVVQTKKAWVLTRLLNKQYYLAIIVSREGTLGNVQLVVKKYLDELQRSV